ncbi:MAG: IMP cyclohydrolase [Patescibacteria group bacterium]|jgi:phosphoribosylaminoimidazolecarboxamide formyltransferase/IMP cyclohydrolase
MAGDLKKMYRTILGDHFPPQMTITFGQGAETQTLVFEKAGWDIGGEIRGLRYGENPGQEAALYRLRNGNLVIGDCVTIQPGQWLVSDMELLQSGKHPGKINLTDADAALNILRYLMDTPCAAIMKHNNPCGVAKASSLVDAYVRADLADRVAAFGGCIALNRAVDKDTAREISRRYAEVVVAPDFEDGVMAILAGRKDLRIIQIRRLDQLAEFAGVPVIDFKSLIDGGVIVQTSFVPLARRVANFRTMTASTVYQGQTYTVNRAPTEAEYADMLFGWLVEAGVTSNSVIFVKDSVTVGIGTGEQDRVGVAEIARDKAYRKLADRLCWERIGKNYNDVLPVDPLAAKEFRLAAEDLRGGLIGSTMVSDAFFPFRDGIDVGLREGVTAVVQPGGSQNDYQVIEACNEFGATMVFTGQRSFKH